MKHPGQQLKGEEKNIYSQSKKKNKSVSKLKRLTGKSVYRFSQHAGPRLGSTRDYFMVPSWPPQTSGEVREQKGKCNKKGTNANGNK